MCYFLITSISHLLLRTVICIAQSGRVSLQTEGICIAHSLTAQLDRTIDCFPCSPAPIVLSSTMKARAQIEHVQIRSAQVI